MKHRVYCVFDQAARAYLPPFILHSDDLAARVFGDAVNESGHQFNKHPEDYSLYRIGDYDDSVALLIAERIHLVTTGLMAKKSLPGAQGNGELFPDLGEQETQLMRRLEEKGGDL